MAYNLPPMSWLRAFEASARLGSFTEAAGELALTQSAVSQQVRSLEQYLGYALFERLPRKLSLTQMGRAYLVPVRQSFSELSTATAGLFGIRSETNLHVRVPVSFAVLWLAPRLAGFSAAHPDIQLRLSSAIWSDALPQDNLDLDIRFGFGSWPGFKSDLLINDGCVIVSPPASKAKTARDILDEPKIHLMGYEQSWAKFYAACDSDPESARRPIIVADTSLAALELVASGAGHAIVLEMFAERYIASRKVKRSIDLTITHDESHFLLVPDSGATPQTKLFSDWLAQEVRKYGTARH